MDPTRNPFTPSAGRQPPELAGREGVLERAEITLRRVKGGRHDRSALLIGLRGVGKPLPQIAGASETLHACAQSLRRLIMLENGVLIPLARRRLLHEDIAALGARFAIRRRTKPA